MWRWCVNGKAQDNDYAYFTVKNVKFDTNIDAFKDVFISVGEPYYYITPIKMGL